MLRIGALSTALSLLILTPATFAQLDLKKQLSEPEFNAAGLQKLTPEEIQILESLISQKLGSPSLSQKTEKVKEAKAAEIGAEQLPDRHKGQPSEVTTRIVGIFEGWDGETRFELENGQVWQQRIGGKVSYDPVENPQVTLYKSMGGYRIRVEGFKQTCAVKRIK